MADVRISALAAAVAANLQGTSLVPTTDSQGSPTTVKVTLAQMRTSLLTRATAGYAATDFLSLGGASAPAAGWIRVDGTTVTSSTPILSATQTWNQGATAFTGILLNVTDTTSAAGSLFVDFQVATISKFSVSKAGTVTTAGNMNTQALTATTGLFTGALTSTMAGGANNAILSATSVTTGNAYVTFNNTSGQAMFGVESSAGASLMAGTSAYSAVFGTGTARSLHLVTNNVVQLTISSAGAATFTSTIAATTGTFSGALTNTLAGTAMVLTPASASYTAIRFNATTGTAKGFVGVDVSGAIATGSTDGDLILRMDGSNIRFASSTTIIGTLTSAGALSISGGITATTGTFSGDVQIASNLYFGGTTASFPKFKRSGAAVLLQLGDESDYADLTAKNLNLPSGGVSTGSGYWTLGAASVVSPTSPNRTVEISIAGTTYYLAAKTTNN